MNYRLPSDLIDYVERWHRATGLDREEVVEKIIRAYQESVGDPPEPQNMPGMPKTPNRPTRK